MSASGSQLAVGVKRAVIYELDTDGFPLATGTTPYTGIEVVGPKAFALTVPESRKISHVGNDRVLAIDYLPPIEGMSGELRVASNDLNAKAAIAGVNVFNVGSAAIMPWGTDKQGFEVDAGLLLFQQSLDTVTKSRRWKYYLIPKARLIPSPASMDENPAEDRYTVAPNPTTKHLWGTTLVEGTEGALEMAVGEGMGIGRPNIVAFKGNGTEDTFLLPVDKPSSNVTNIVVWVDGVLQTTELGIVTLTSIPFDVAPATGAIIVVYYEY